MHYVGSLDNFRIRKEGTKMFVTSYKDGFESYYAWPDGVSLEDDNVLQQIHKERYLKIKRDYEEFLS